MHTLVNLSAHEVVLAILWVYAVALGGNAEAFCTDHADCGPDQFCDHVVQRCTDCEDDPCDERSAGFPRQCQSLCPDFYARKYVCPRLMTSPPTVGCGTVPEVHTQGAQCPPSTDTGLWIACGVLVVVVVVLIGVLVFLLVRPQKIGKLRDVLTCQGENDDKKDDEGQNEPLQPPQEADDKEKAGPLVPPQEPDDEGQNEQLPYPQKAVLLQNLGINHRP